METNDLEDYWKKKLSDYDSRINRYLGNILPYAMLLKQSIIDKREWLNDKKILTNINSIDVELNDKELYLVDMLINFNLDVELNDNLTNGLNDNLDNNLTNVLNDNLTNGLTNGLNDNLTNNLTNGLNDNLTNNLTNGLNDNLDNNLTNGLNDNLDNGLTNMYEEMLKRNEKEYDELNDHINKRRELMLEQMDDMDIINNQLEQMDDMDIINNQLEQMDSKKQAVITPLFRLTKKEQEKLYYDIFKKAKNNVISILRCKNPELSNEKINSIINNNEYHTDKENIETLVYKESDRLLELWKEETYK